MAFSLDGQINAKALYDMLKKVSELAKNGGDLNSRISFKVWDNSDRKQQNPSYPDYSVSFKIGDGPVGAWVSGISIWVSKSKESNVSNNTDDSNDSDLPFLSDKSNNKIDDEEDEKINIEDLPF